MASLRSRLLLAVIGITAAGLVLLAAIVYLEQRSFLLDRVDQQAQAALFPAVSRINDTDGDGPGYGGPGGPGPDRAVPAGTWAAVYTPSGVRASDPVVLGLYRGQTRPPAPDIGREDLGDGARTVAAVSGSGRYRVISQRDRFSNARIVIAVPLADTDQTLSRLLVVEALVIGGVLLLIGLGAWVVVRVGLLPLDRMGHTAGRIAGGDLSHRVADTDPRSEVGRLGGSLNAMLDRLEEAFSEREASEARLRTFIADASHELRTPLTSIRGYAELYRIGVARGEADTARAMQRIEEEATRMGVLVEDLLTLARLDSVEEVARAPVHLAPLVRDAVDDARASAPEREIAVDAADAGVVSGDRDGLRQVLANLLRNALVHTPPGTPIEVGVHREAGALALTVRDHGPGLPTDDGDALFERFWRAEGGRERGKGGAGLGLAIVAGIVDAHGGTVAAANADDGGAIFTVRLPAAAESQTPLRSS